MAGEAASEVFGWGELHKYVYCQHLLSGTTKLAVQQRTTIVSYATLKAYLEEEFGSAVDEALVHRQLAAMRRGIAESMTGFAYRVQGVAGNDRVHR